MPDFGFVGPSYEAPSIYQDAQECINFRPEIDPLKQPGQNGVVALYPTPGLTIKCVLDTGEVRGLRTVSGGQYLVAVCQSDVYVVDSTFNPVHIGALNTSTGIVGITDNGINVYIVDGSYRYTWRINSLPVTNFVASISSTTLTVSSVQSGAIRIGQQIFGVGMLPNTIITALGTGTGGVGTYTVNISQLVVQTSMTGNSVIYNHEQGTNDNTTAMTSYIASSDFDLVDGDQFILTKRIIPDLNFAGSTATLPAVTMYIKPRNFPGSAYSNVDSEQVIETSVDIYTEQIFMRARARQMAVEIASTDLGVQWQLGSPRLDGRPDGKR
jgi:hypothetical protein